MRIIVKEAVPVPVYKQIKEEIKNYLIENKVREGTPLPDIKTIASIAGVSLKTAERALNELIKENICFRRPKKGTFVGKINYTILKKKICGVYHARGLKSFEKDLVQSAIYRGISEQSQKEGIDLFFITTEAEESISFYLRNSELDFKGIIMLHWEDLSEGKILAKKFPYIKIVFLNYYLDGFEDTPSNIYGVFNDDYAGAYQMTEYLIEKGHKKIAIFTIELRNENYRQRVEGYKHALEDNGIKFERDFVYIMERREGVDLREVGRSLARSLINKGTKVSAIFCVNDVMATGVIDYLREIGKGEIKVVGYDDIIPHLSRDYKFSTVKVDFEKMGKKAISILTDKDNKYPKILKIPPKLLIRN